MNKKPYVKAETEIVEIKASELVLASGLVPAPGGGMSEELG